MRIINTSVCAFQNKVLVIGFEGENERTQVRIDASEVFTEYPHATPSLTVKPYSGEAYPAMVNRDGTDVVWDITSSYLTERGECEIQLTFIKDSVVCKSYIGKALVLRSLTVEGEMPTPVESWVDAANAKLAEVDAQIVELEGMVDTATDAATRAEQSASTASAKAEQAAGSAATATEKATEATNAAGTATAKAAEAEQSALTATDKANAAAESERIATAKAGEATTAAGTATAKAEQATEAAQTATEKAGDASASATAAQESATDAAASATAASESETAAKASETAASTSATQAAQSAQGASADAQTATQKSAEAQQSATGAAQSEQTATQKAEEAAESAQAASDAKTAVEQTVEQLADSLEQIDQNTQDIAELDERKANIDGYYPDMTVGNAEQLNSSKFVENSEPYTFRTSGGSSDIGNREYLDAVVGGTVAWNQAVRDEASENSTDFADVVTVNDAVEDAAGVKVKLEPVQDLHGYDNPWPAGGGKNKLKYPFFDTTKTVNGVTFIDNGDGTLSISGTATSVTNFDLAAYNTAVLSEGDYVVSLGGGSNNCYFVYGGGDSGISFGTAYGTGVYAKTIHVTASGVIGYCVVQVPANATVNLTVKPMIRLASETDATFSPYSNICPITGWDGVQVWDDPAHGGNVNWNQLFQPYAASYTSNGITYALPGDGTVSVSGTATANTTLSLGNIQATNGHVYMLTGCPSGGGYNKYALYANGMSQQLFDTGEGSIKKQTADSTGQFYFIVYPGMSVNFTIKPQLFDLTQMFGEGNEPATVEEFKALFPADYYPYNAGKITTVSAVNGDPYRHYSITLPTEAGTVYGGELTVNADGSGSLVVDRVADALTGQESMGAVDIYYAVANTHAHPVWTAANVFCSHFAQSGTNSVASGNASTNVWFRLDKTVADFATLEAFRSYIANQYTAGTPVTISYKLATPITHTLTAAQIRTLLGQNNVWADTGDLALTYTGTDEHLVLENGKKYLSRLSGTDSMLLGSGQEITAAKGTDNVFDLTQMFGTDVADYVYGQGASFFRRWFGKQWYPYNAGELLSVEGLQSHDMVGFNLWDEEWELGYFDLSTGQPVSNSSISRSKNFIPVLPNTVYYYKSGGTNHTLLFYDAEKNYVSNSAYGGSSQTFTTPSNAHFMKLAFVGTTYNHDICLNLAHNNSRNGEYEPYEKHSYPLDSSVILRGIPKVGANGVYWDGDRYLPDGTVERRYGVKDLGTLDWTYMSGYGYFYDTMPTVLGSNDNIVPNMFTSNGMHVVAFVDRASLTTALACFQNSNKQLQIRNTGYTDVASFKAAMSGVYLVYELATPTTETAQPYHSTQWVSDWGTEEFVSTGIVPVGHETRYPANLRDKLQHLPDAASGNGSYLITQTDGQMVLTPFPAPPSTAGNYVLKATVVNGVATYTWEVAT